MAVPVISTTAHGRTWGSSLTISIAVAAGEILTVGVGVWGNNQVPKATFNGVSMEEVEGSGNAGSYYRMTWFVLRAPSTGTHNVVISTGGGGWYICAGAYCVSTIAGAALSVALAAGNSTAPSVTITSDANALVLDILADTGNNITKTVGGGQTSLFQEDSVANTDLHASGSWAAGAASVTMSWTMSGANNWGIAALSITETPAANARISQLIEETVTLPTPLASVSQLVTETVTLPEPSASVSQLVFETVTTFEPAANIRVSHLVIETITPIPPAIPPYTFPVLTVAG